jgi:hypothetical protein
MADRTVARTYTSSPRRPRSASRRLEGKPGPRLPVGKAEYVALSQIQAGGVGRARSATRSRTLGSSSSSWPANACRSRASRWACRPPREGDEPGEDSAFRVTFGLLSRLRGLRGGPSDMTRPNPCSSGRPSKSSSHVRLRYCRWPACNRLFETAVSSGLLAGVSMATRTVRMLSKTAGPASLATMTTGTANGRGPGHEI